MADQEKGIKLFGTTIAFHGRQAVKDDHLLHHNQPTKDDHNPTVDKRPDKIIPCPRCKSMETKFCYFNNYNVNQPRHFCKGCQRYWTAGGALRNVPVGAGRRKAKSPNFSEGACFYEGSGGDDGGGMRQFELDGVVMEDWQVAGHGGFRHVIPLKRRRINSVQCEGK